MDPSSQNTDKSQGGVETPRNPYARGNSFDRPGTEPKVQTAETIKAMQPEQPTVGPVFSAPTPEPAPTPQAIPVTPAPLPSQHTTASGTGDIVLPSDQPAAKKSKKPLVFAIIAVVLLVGAFVAYTIATSTKSSQTVASADVKADFNRYANYLLYGEDSDQPLEGEYDEEASYVLYEKINSSDEEEFFKKAQSLLDNFDKSFYRTESGDEELKSLVGTYIGNFEIVKYNSLNGDIDYKALEKEYINTGLADTKEWVEDYYSNLIHSNYDNAKQYGTYQTDYWNLTADLLQRADNNGCLQNKTFDITCLNNLVSDEENNKFSEYKDNTFDILDTAENSIVKDCWEINKKLSGEKQ